MQTPIKKPQSMIVTGASGDTTTKLKKCWENFPKQYGECKERAVERWDACNRIFKKHGRPPFANEENKEYDGYPDD